MTRITTFSRLFMKETFVISTRFCGWIDARNAVGGCFFSHMAGLGGSRLFGHSIFLDSWGNRRTKELFLYGRTELV